MPVQIFCCCLGIFLVTQFSILPAWYWCAVLLLISIISIKFIKLRSLGAFCLGLIWAIFYGWWGLDSRLPTDLEKKDLWVEGVVVEMPKITHLMQRFELKVDCLWLTEKTCDQQLRRLRLSIYQDDLRVLPGERWRFQVRLKRPRGFANPGGFNYAGWLFQNRIDGVGYVRNHADNQLIEQNHIALFDQFRYQLKQRIDELNISSQVKGIVNGLVIGDRQNINQDQWQVFSKTGTNHLLAISGLHIGLIAFLVYYFTLIFLRWLVFFFNAPIQIIAVIMSLLAAIMYSGLAGFSLPTQRACIMLLVMVVAKISLRSVRPMAGFTLALLAVLLWDPLAPLSSGFWLSFIAVGVLLFSFAGRYGPNGLWWRWGRAQWVIFLAIFPLLAIYYYQVPLLAPVANIIAVPVMSFLLVPLCLVAIILLFIYQPLAEFCFQIFSWLFEVLWECLVFISELDLLWFFPSLNTLQMFALVCAVILLLLPKGMYGRWFAVIFLLPLWFHQSSELRTGDLRMTVLDVGQGLAVVLQTTDHVMLYDTGPAYSRAFNAGAAVILPYLRSQGITKIDTLIVSHGDNDHIGGLDSLLNNIEVSELITGTNKNINTAIPVKKCQANQNWALDNVKFSILYGSGVGKSKENNRSCVLMIESHGKKILLPGDIEKEVESELINEYGKLLSADIVIAPHHGSLTSSTQGFIDSVSPKHVIMSTGYLNPYGHPHPKVVQRYKNNNVLIMNTVDAGAVTYTFSKTNELQLPLLHRQENKKYWSSD